jgi:hypothetical protein
MPVAAKARLCSVDQYGLQRLTKSEAKTPQGMMRCGEKIIEEGLHRLEANKTKRCGHRGERCVTIDPNWSRTQFPFTRVESPHGGWKRRLPGWTDCRLILPKLLLEGLRALTIELAHQQQNSDWPGERRRYPATKNYHVAAALNAYLRQLGFEQFCVEEQKPIGRRVRRFVAPNP